MSSFKGCNEHENWILNAVNAFNLWDRDFSFWKSFSSQERCLVRAYIGLAFFGRPPEYDESDLRDIWFKYPKAHRDLITDLEDKLKYENGRVTIGHTCLYLNDNGVCCVLRQMKSNNQIIFIDCIGRVYQSWDDFRDNNQLPICKYMAPEDGIHKIVKQQLLIYLSPAGSLGSKVLKATDYIASGLSLIAVGLVFVATTPVSALIVGGVGTAHCVGRSVAILKDRSNHEQSIGFDNPESILSWLNIVTSLVSGASTATLSKSVAIVEASGSYANIAKAALKGINYAALTSNVFNFGTYLYTMQQKIQRGEKLTTIDYMEGCVNLFLIVGTVSTTRQMHKFIDNLQAAPKTSVKRLTRTEKRKLRRLRAKLRNDNGIVSGNADVKKVTTLEENVPDCSIRFLLNAGQQFLGNHINIDNIYFKCLEIWQTCCDFRYNKIHAVVFVTNMINHVQNLFIIITEALASIKAKVEPFLKSYFCKDAPSSLTEQIGHMVENTTLAVKSFDETLLEDENEQPVEDKPKLKYEIIFEAVKNRIPRMTHSNDIISTFSEQLSLLIEEITNELNNNYEAWVSRNIEILGKNKANKLFSTFGIKTVNDFANLNFIKIVESKNIDVESNHTAANEEIIQKMWTGYARLLSKVAPQSTLAELGAIETCQLLKTSLTEVFNPLDKKFKSAKELYDINASFLGHVTAMSLVKETLGVESTRCFTSDNSTFFDLAAHTLNFDRIVQDLSFEINCEKRTNKSSSQPELTDDNVQYTVLSLCDKFFRKVHSKLNITNNEEREKRVKDCYQYFMENFTNFIQEMSKAQNDRTLRCLMIANTFFDRQTFVSSYKKACEISKFEAFASAVEHFTQDQNIEALAEKYIVIYKVANNFYVEVCTEINKEDGIRIFSINEGGYSNLRAYKENAAKLFNLDVNQMELIKWEKGAVILKCDQNRNIIFQTVETKLMIAMEIDTSKESNSD